MTALVDLIHVVMDAENSRRACRAAALELSGNRLCTRHEYPKVAYVTDIGHLPKPCGGGYLPLPATGGTIGVCGHTASVAMLDTDIGGQASHVITCLERLFRPRFRLSCSLLCSSNTLRRKVLLSFVQMYLVCFVHSSGGGLLLGPAAPHALGFTNCTRLRVRRRRSVTPAPRKVATESECQRSKCRWIPQAIIYLRYRVCKK